MVGSVTLSIKNVPTEVVERLKARAVRNARSLQDELLSILEAASYSPPIGDLSAFVARLGLTTPSESAEMIREDRDDPLR